MASVSRWASPFIQIFAGKGNNGGDAFVVAHYLADMGLDVQLLLAGDASQLKGDAAQHFARMVMNDVEVHQLTTVENWKELASTPQAGGHILVDGLLGTGVTGPARGLVAAAIRAINTFGRRAQVVSIDVPSGLNTDTGRASGDCVVADLTVTMAMPKRGMLEPCALEYVGSLEVLDIGIPEVLTRPLASDRELIADGDIRAMFPRRLRTSHKGTYGHVLLLGGSVGYMGAASLAAESAARSGAGLVTALVPACAAGPVANLVPEVMVHTAPGCDDMLSAEGLKQSGHELRQFDAVVVGPGLGQSAATLDLVSHLLEQCECPLVLDADALNVCADDPSILSTARGPVLITPHPGEMARLMGCRTNQVQARRCEVAQEAAERFKATVILKGAGTIVVARQRPVAVNMTGNPGMATGGMGDVLAGLLGGFLAQGLCPYDAARSAVYVHGRAGDSASRAYSQAGLLAGDVINELSFVLRDLMGR
jgi:NAD(P)H-hydrate epimerase